MNLAFEKLYAGFDLLKRIMLGKMVFTAICV